MRLAAGLWLCASCSRPFPWSNHFPCGEWRAVESKAERHSGCSLVGVIDVWPLKALPALFICLLLFFQWFFQYCFSLRRCVSCAELEGWGGVQPAMSTISEPIDIMAIHKSNLIAPESKMCWFGSLREAELTESLFKLLMRTTDVEACTIVLMIVFVRVLKLCHNLRRPQFR